MTHHDLLSCKIKEHRFQGAFHPVFEIFYCYTSFEPSKSLLNVVLGEIFIIFDDFNVTSFCRLYNKMCGGCSSNEHA